VLRFGGGPERARPETSRNTSTGGPARALRVQVEATAVDAVVGKAVVARHARLLGGEQPLFLRAELDDLGEATSATLARPTPEASIHSKVIARYISSYLAAREPNVSGTGPARPSESMLSGES